MIDLSLIGNLDLLSVGLAIASTAIIGFSVLFNNYHSKTNRAFFYFVVLTAFWGFFNLMSYRITNNVGLAFLFIRIELFLAVWYVFAIFQLFYVFPSEAKVNLPFWYRRLLIPWVFVVSLLTFTPLVFSRVSSVADNGSIRTLDIGFGMPIFGITVIGILIISFAIFLRKTNLAKKEEKGKFSLLLIGSLITFTLIISFIFILPAFFANSDFVPFGAVFTLPFVIFAAYAILKHKLFNVKVAGTALLVFALSIVSFLEVILADSWIIILYRSGIFVLVLCFGILLIKGVLKEVEQREEIAKMAEDVRRAYAIEKKAKEDLEKLDKVKDQFVMTTQHNLRTPLTSMMGYTDLLLQGAFGKQSKKTTEVLKRFQTSTQNLIKMVNNFLDMAQFQLGRSVITLKSGVDVVSIIDEIVADLLFKAESKGVKLTFDKPKKELKIKADREKLKAALFNVIDNAVKYTERGSVEVNVKETEGSKILFMSKDTGIGIAKEKLAGIFEQMFERSEDAKRIASVGSGVGLYLSGEIVKAHQGKAWAESEGEGKGSTFYVELPLETNKPVSGEVLQQPSNSLPK